VRLKAFVDSGKGLLRGSFHPADFQAVRAAPGRTRWLKRDLSFEATRANIEFLNKTFPGEIEWEDSGRLARVAELSRLEAKGPPPLPPESQHFRFKTKPFRLQEEAFFKARGREFFGYIMEMGTGKTKVCLDDIASLYAEGKIDRAVIIAPNGVQDQWAVEQVPRHLPDWVEHESLVYISKSKETKKFRDRLAVVDASPKLRLYFIHCDALSHKSGVGFVAARLDKKTMLVVDESIRFKNAGSSRTKNLMKISQDAGYRRILSGAPISLGVEDLFSQLHILSPDLLGFSSFYTFRNHFCLCRAIRGAPAGAVEIVGYQNLEELTARLDAHTYRAKRDRKDGELTYVRRKVPMTDEQNKLYYSLRDDLFAQLESGELVETPLAITKLIKMYQVVCGYLRPEEGPWVPIPNNRVSAALEVVEDTQKLVIWAMARPDIEQISAALKKAGVGYVEYHGGIPSQDRAAQKAAFLESDKKRVFLSNQAVGGTGMDGLQQVCSAALYFSNGFNADLRWQSEARINRSGQKDTCWFGDLVSPGTIDIKILDVLEKRENVARSILDVRELLSVEEGPPGG